MKLILATISPYRIEAFKKLGVDFIAEGSNVDEEHADRPTDPVDLIQYLAKLKAEAVAQRHTEGIIIGFDSVAWFDGQILDKPTSREAAFERLQRLSGATYEYCTGVHIISLDNGKILSTSVRTQATLRNYSDKEIIRYMDHCDEKYLTHAHGYNPENYYSMLFIQNLSGDPYNFMLGIPLGSIMGMLQDIGFNL